MSEIISSRRSFLVGFGALIAAPAIVNFGNIMPVKQMLILPDRLEDITFPITGEVRSSAELIYLYGWKSETLATYDHSKWRFGGTVWQGLSPQDVNDRWERMKAREKAPQWDAKVSHALDYAERIKQNGYQYPEWKTS